MALITINGVEFPTPVVYKFSEEPLGVWERNALGDLVGDLIALKAKVELSWGILTPEQVKVLLSGVRPNFIDVTFLDPRTDDYTTGTFYASPRSMQLSHIDNNGQRFWKEVAFNLVER